MKIAYATFIDNQEIIGYPLGVLLQDTPLERVFFADIPQMGYAGMKFGSSNENGFATVINHKIKTPGDIAAVQNICLDMLFDEGHDYVVWIQADMYCTNAVRQIVGMVCIPGNEHLVWGLTVRHLRLFHLSRISNWGVTIIGRNCPDRFQSDGAHVGSAGNPAIGGPDTVIDIGYLGIEQYRNHLRQHAKTWNSDNHNYLLPQDEFIRNVIEYNRREVGLYEFIKPDSKYYELVKKLNLEEEYEYVKNLLYP